MRRSLVAFVCAVGCASSSPVWAGASMAAGMGSFSYGFNASMAEALAKKLAAANVAAADGMAIIRAVARSSVVKYVGRSGLVLAPLLLASDLMQDKSILVNGDGSNTVTLSGPAMDGSMKPGAAMPTGTWQAVIQQMGYPNTATFLDTCTGGRQCAREISTWQYQCPNPNQQCTTPTNQIGNNGYTVQGSLGLGYSNTYYQFVLVGEKLPARYVDSLTYTPTPLSTPRDVASALPDSRKDDLVPAALPAKTVSGAIDDARTRYPDLPWPTILQQPNAIKDSDIARSIPLSGVVPPIVTSPTDQWPPGWPDGIPADSPYAGWQGLGVPSTGDPSTPASSPSVDLGSAPAVSEPTLEEPPTGLTIMEPIISALNPLKGMNFPSGAGECPTFDVDLSLLQEGTVKHVDEYCTVADQVKPIFQPVMMLVWALMAVFIVLGA